MSISKHSPPSLQLDPVDLLVLTPHNIPCNSIPGSGSVDKCVCVRLVRRVSPRIRSGFAMQVHGERRVGKDQDDDAISFHEGDPSRRPPEPQPHPHPRLHLQQDQRPYVSPHACFLVPRNGLFSSVVCVWCSPRLLTRCSTLVYISGA
jgi:hypothetical protein